MLFELKVQRIGQTGSDVIPIEGDLDTVKTYLKLGVDEKTFNWGSIERKDELVPGDVNRWLVQRNYRDGSGLYMSVFSFFDVDPEININAAVQAHNPDRTSSGALNKLMGGGKF